MNQALDILYILGRGSKHDNMELRLSLRCLEKNCHGMGRVFIVGNKPDWVQNVVHIPAEDTWTAENNAFQKILKACRSDISDTFLLMNDDFFMLKEFDIDYPQYVRGELKITDKDDPYSLSVNKTVEFLNDFGIEMPANFEVHCPILFNKHKFLLLENIAERFKKEQTGLLCRSLYWNIFSNKYCEVVQDTKLRTDEWKDPNQTSCISTSDDCDNILKVIEGMYPNKSRWEK